MGFITGTLRKKMPHSDPWQYTHLPLRLKSGVKVAICALIFVAGFVLGVKFYQDDIVSYLQKVTDIRGNILTNKVDMTVKLPDDSEIFYPAGSKAIIIQRKDDTFLIVTIEGGKK